LPARTDAVQKPVFQMLTVYDQLIALKYHLEFTKLAGIKTIHPYYFISSTNSGEQYYAFVTLAAWLIKKCNRSINMPQESDDPNMVISGILDHARALVIIICLFES
jgi:estrogen-related receptor beta like 1